ncbi:hypothetical protein [Nocardia brasiliensis]|uniref:hypothetical protein n=1 Tax=Nocardia brasiliensis TaxID=37326 RepID=UPI002455F146|nr:hypothetical protein [Nocardia brasiliensis]
MAYEAGSVEFAISHEEMAEMTVDDLRALLEEEAKEFGDQQVKRSYKALDQVTAETGNVIDAGGNSLTVDLFLETIRKISIAFDKFGNPQMPTIVIHPSMAEKYRSLLEEANNDEDTKRRLNESPGRVPGPDWPLRHFHQRVDARRRCRPPEGARRPLP